MNLECRPDSREALDRLVTWVPSPNVMSPTTYHTMIVLWLGVMPRSAHAMEAWDDIKAAGTSDCSTFC